MWPMFARHGASYYSACLWRLIYHTNSTYRAHNTATAQLQHVDLDVNRSCQTMANTDFAFLDNMASAQWEQTQVKAISSISYGFAYNEMSKIEILLKAIAEVLPVGIVCVTLDSILKWREAAELYLKSQISVLAGKSWDICSNRFTTADRPNEHILSLRVAHVPHSNDFVQQWPSYLNPLACLPICHTCTNSQPC